MPPLHSRWPLSLLILVAAGVAGAQAPVTRSPGDNLVAEVGGKSLKQWMDELKHADPSVREEAIRALTLFGPEAARAVPLVVERLQDGDSSPRVKAVIALNMLEIHKEDVPRVVAALGQRLLNDNQSVVRYQAATTLQRFGEDARGAQAGLAKGVTDPATWEIRHACVIALRKAGRDPKGGPNHMVERALLEAIRDPTFQVRLEAVMALGALGVPDDPALLLTVVKGLQERLIDRDPTVKIWAHVALMALDKVSDTSVQAVIKFLKHNELKVRVHAARGLGAMGAKGKAAIPALIAALQDKEVPAVAAAGWALGQMDELAGSTRAALTDLLKNPEPAMRAAGAQALGNAGPKARAAIAPLIELVQDKEQPPFVVATACWALGEIADPAGPAPAALTAVVQRKDVDESLKQVARDALEQIRKPKK